MLPNLPAWRRFRAGLARRSTRLLPTVRVNRPHVAALVACTTLAVIAATHGPAAAVADEAADTVTFSETPAALWPFATSRFSWSAPAGPPFECRLDDDAWQPCTSPTVRTLPNGTYRFEVRRSDGDSALPTAHHWTVDKPVEPVTIDEPQPPLSDDVHVRVGFSSSEPAAGYDCRLDAAEWEPCEPPYERAVPNGAHTLELRTRDRLGNLQETPTTTTFTIEAALPDTMIDDAPADPSEHADVSFSFSSPSSAVTFECQLAEQGYPAAWQECSSPFTARRPARTYIFAVRAVDPAGQADPTPASHTWTIVEPEEPLDTTIVSGPAETTSDPRLEFEFASNHAGATFECNWGYHVGSSSWVSCPDPAVFTATTSGELTLTVRARNAFDRSDATPVSWTTTVELLMPTTTFTSTPPASTSSMTATFTFESLEGATFSCRTNARMWHACASPYTVDAGGGANFLEVRATANGVVEQTPARYSWTVALPTPDTVIDGGPTPGSTSSYDTATFRFSSTQPGSYFECNVAGSGWHRCISPYTTLPLYDGSYTFRVRASNGTTDPTPAQRSWTIKTAPVSRLTSWPDAFSTVRRPTFTFIADRSNVSFQCRIDSATWYACVSPHQVPAALADGWHRFQVRAVGSTGKVEQWPSEWEWEVDATAPETTVVMGPEPATRQRTGSFFVAASEPLAGFECRLDDASDWSSCEAHHLITVPLFDGPHEFHVRAIDLAGNVDATPARWSWTVLADAEDSTAPSAVVAEGPAPYHASTDAAFSLTADEPVDHFLCSLDGGDWEACAGDVTFTGLAEGMHQLAVRAIDAAGNVEPEHMAAVHEWTADVTPPTTAMIVAPPPLIAQRVASFRWVADEPVQRFECRHSDGDWFTCRTPFYITFHPGPRELEVRAVDLAGNVEPAPVVHAWQQQAEGADTVAPVSRILSGPDELTHRTSAEFAFESDEGDVRLQCRLDGGSWGACREQRVYHGPLAEGRHVFRVRGIDWLGNVEQPAATWAWEIDSVAPRLTFVTRPAAVVNETTAVVQMSSSEPTAVHMCQLDGGFWEFNCPLLLELAGLADGPHSVRMYAFDDAGNSAMISHAWTVDTSRPQTVLDEMASTPVGATASRSATAVFSSPSGEGATFECKLNTRAWTTCASPYTVTGLPDGRYTLQVRAVHPEAGSDPTPVRTSWTVDTTRPQVNMSAPGPTSLGAATAARWSISDGAAGSGIAGRAVHVRAAAPGGSWGAWQPRQLSSTATSFTLAGMRPGYGYCVRVSATDNVGLVTRRQRCTTRPINNTSFGRSGFTSRRGTGRYLNTFAASSRYGARVSARVRAKRLALVATRCSSCGAVEVRINGRRIKRISLVSPRTRRKQVIGVASFARVRSGTVTVHVVSRRRPVHIEGLLAAQH